MVSSKFRYDLLLFRYCQLLQLRHLSTTYIYHKATASGKGSVRLSYMAEREDLNLL